MTTLTLTPVTAGTATLTAVSYSGRSLAPSNSLFPSNSLYPAGGLVLSTAVGTGTLTLTVGG